MQARSWLCLAQEADQGANTLLHCSLWEAQGHSRCVPLQARPLPRDRQLGMYCKSTRRVQVNRHCNMGFGLGGGACSWMRFSRIGSEVLTRSEVLARSEEGTRRIQVNRHCNMCFGLGGSMLSDAILQNRLGGARALGGAQMLGDDSGESQYPDSCVLGFVC